MTNTDSLLGRNFDEYRIEKRLGVGGMATVYRALDTRLRRYVALKVIATQFRTDPQYKERFEREAQAIARLEHPNIVRIYRFGEVDGMYYMAMQYVEGADVGWLIEDYKANKEVMRREDMLRVVRDIGTALDYSHSQGVIHRDVKPRNIIVNKNGQAILTDFGLALQGDIGTHGETFGSPHYIAPEQAISSANVVPQSDLYSLGVTLFEMLTGELPFDADQPMDIAMQHIADAPPPPSRFNPVVPPTVDEVVLRSMAKDVSERYQTGAEFASALEQALSGWGAAPSNNMESARRPSILLMPSKVEDFMRTEPLPPDPPTLPEVLPPFNIPEQGVFAETQPNVSGVPEISTAPETIVASRPVESPYADPPFNTGVPSPQQPYSERHYTAPPTQRNERPQYAVERRKLRESLLLLGVSGAFIAALCLLAGLFFAVLSRNNASPSPTSAAAEAGGAELLTSPTVPTPAPTETPFVTPTAAILFITATPQIGLTTAPVVVSPIVQPTVAPLPNVPPADRSVVPQNSRRLGEFQVEWYCNERNYGVQLTNNNADWACTQGGSVVSILQPADFDAICQRTYNNPGAFAVRDMQKDVQAYNWSCYEFVPQAAVAPAAATPSPFNLQLDYQDNYVAFVNVSDTAIDMTGFQLQGKEGRVLNASDWGVTTLQPGACLRIFRSEQPSSLPTRCASVVDYAGNEEQRRFWFDGRIAAVYSPSIRLFYPPN
jgi:serine/threonine protein kinase